MADLLDIAPATSVEAVTIGDGRIVDVRLLNANDVAGLLARFPGLLAVLVGGGVNTASLMASGGEAIAAIIAAGSDHLGDERAEAIANTFTIEDQARLIDTILRLSFPNGVRVVLQALEGIAATMMRGVDDAPKGGQDALETIALTITSLIRRGFPPDYVMRLSLHQIASYEELLDKLDRAERALALNDTATAVHSGEKAVNKRIKELVGHG